MLAVVRGILRCEHAANDATQDALLSAFRHFASFRGDSAFRTWLYRIALTTALGYLRKQRRSREDVLDDPELLPKQLVDPAPRPDEVASANELAAHVRDLLPSLQREQRKVLELRIADHTEAEIARELGISLANVKIRAFRARNQLREALAA
ncbi:MAG: sigma-70 family RNA polymerase sigma factor [Myxococcota bacterium]|nr:sigma-70 family RNA polymerase sigma factor [Myxococcota bacterium]